jgi:AcrR family transcriptional regulator
MDDVKQKILQTAHDRFLKYGIRKMSVQKLVMPMGISTKTVYKYFKNKEELLEEVLRYYFAQQYQLFEKFLKEKSTIPLFFEIWYLAVEREYSVNNAFFHDLHYYYPELEHKAEREIGEAFWNRLRDVLRKGVHEGVLRKNIHIEIILEAIAVLFGKITRTALFQQFKATPYEIFLNTIVPVIRGICTTKGLNELDRHIAAKTPFKTDI